MTDPVTQQPAFDELLAGVRELQARAQAARHRQVILLSGAAAWSRELTTRLAGALAPSASAWLGEGGPADWRTLPMGQAQQLLGQETDLLVFDGFTGFDPDALGAVSGTLCAGGLLFLLGPALEDWPRLPGDVATEQPSRFLSRLARVLSQDDAIWQVEMDQPLSALPDALPVADASSIGIDGPCRTSDQAQAVAAVVHVATGHRRRPVVLVADRGRGKSAAFGIAVAECIRQGKEIIRVVGPRWASVEPVFRHAAQQLPGSELHQGLLRYGPAEMRFCAPDAVPDDPADLVLVDEAAALPVPLLANLLKTHARIAFATTVHGYEGTGRGFAVRFQQVLERETPEWRSLRLEAPVRYAVDDPLELLVFRALLLDAEPVDAAEVEAALPESCRFERLSRDALLNNESLLASLFGLLVLAHYRTRPQDLYHLLDAAGLSVYAGFHQDRLVATALVLEEGGLDEALVREVFAGRRRTRGQLIPQTLAKHLGQGEAVSLRGARVMRIAVHPAIQGRGIGRQLLRFIEQAARSDKLDWLGASFGASVPLLRFWQTCGCWPVSLGYSREASSGEYAMLVLKPLTAEGEALAAEARQKFQRVLLRGLPESWSRLDAGIVAQLLRHFSPAGVLPDERDWRELAAFAWGKRGYEDTLPALTVFTGWLLTNHADDEPTAELHALLIARVLQHQSWTRLAHEAGLSGYRPLIERLRGLLGQCLKQLSRQDPAAKIGLSDLDT